MSLRTTDRQVTVVLVATALLSGCVSSARIAELGDQQVAEVEQSMGILRDPGREAYVRAIGTKLAAVSDRPEGPWSFRIVDTPEPNAFALPGGHVFVSRGLLALVNSEDELAGVIGHEIGHVTAEHAESRIRASAATSPFSIASGLAGWATGIVSPSLGRVVASSGQVLTQGLVIAPHGRAQENEADAIGQALAAKAGYDPAALPHFLGTLGRELTLLAGKQREPSFLDTHPMTADRAARTQQRAAGLVRGAGRPIARDQGDLFSKLEGILVGDDPAEGVFEENRFLHPGIGLALTFPASWKPVNTRAAAGALSPAADALVTLSMARQDTSLDALVAELEAEQSGPRLERFRVGDLPAARMRMSERGRFIELTLVGHRGSVYGVLGQTGERNATRYTPDFDATARSFRALRPEERAAIRESRLRVRQARAGEDAAAVARRTGASWSAEQIAVANALEAETRLRAGQLLKVGIPQAYTPRAR